MRNTILVLILIFAAISAAGPQSAPQITRKHLA